LSGGISYNLTLTKQWSTWPKQESKREEKNSNSKAQGGMADHLVYL